MIYKITDKCTGRGLCVEKCPENAIIKIDRRYFITNDCVGCGDCFRVCPAETIVTIGRNNLVKEEDIQDKKRVICTNVWGIPGYSRLPDCEPRIKIPKKVKIAEVFTGWNCRNCKNLEVF